MKTVLSLILSLALLICGLPALAGGDTIIELADSSARITGGGAAFADGSVVIRSAGSYVVRGALAQGQITVDADKTDKVTIKLDGVSLTNPEGPCIYAAQCDKLIIELVGGSENRLMSGASLPDKPGEEASGAALQAKDDLKIRGEGRLTVYGCLNNGIQTADDLVIVGGEIIVVAANNGIKGKDSLTVKGGKIAVQSLGDGLVSEGNVEILGGSVAVVTDGGHKVDSSAAPEFPGAVLPEKIALPEGMRQPASVPDQPAEETPDQTSSATQNPGKNGASFRDQPSWGGSMGRGMGGFRDEGNPNKDASAASAKGVKGGESILISGGAVLVDARDDGLHAKNISVTGGSICVASDDDGLHADEALTVSGGSVVVPVSYEGMEAKNVCVSGGDISLYATDDGINAADGAQTPSPFGRAPVKQADENTPRIAISGGNLIVIAEVDGLDANGIVEISGGSILVRGQNQSFDGAVDVDISAAITGGTLLAIGGGSGFTTNIDSAQCVFSTSFRDVAAAGETLTVRAEDGTEIYSAVLPRPTSVFTFSSPALAIGASYTVSAGSETVSVSQTAVAVGSMGDNRGGFNRGGQR